MSCSRITAWRKGHLLTKERPMVNGEMSIVNGIARKRASKIKIRREKSLLPFVLVFTIGLLSSNSRNSGRAVARMDVFRACDVQDFPGLDDTVRLIAMNGEEIIAFVQPAFVMAAFLFGNA